MRRSKRWRRSKRRTRTRRWRRSILLLLTFLPSYLLLCPHGALSAAGTSYFLTFLLSYFFVPSYFLPLAFLLLTSHLLTSYFLPLTVLCPHHHYCLHHHPQGEEDNDSETPSFSFDLQERCQLAVAEYDLFTALQVAAHLAANCPVLCSK